jgi:hypothetical protein
MNFKLVASAAVVIAGSCAVANAQTFDSRTDFETAAASEGIPLTGFESFEGFTPNPSGFTDLIEADGFDVTGQELPSGFSSIFTIETNAQSGLVPTDGAQLLRASTFDQAEITFTFDNPVFAVGFDIIGAGNFGGPGSITVENDLGQSFTVFSGDNNDDNETFFAGFVSETGFTSLTLLNTFDGDSFGIDSVTYGVPTPGAVSLLAFAGLAASRRRR